MAILDDIRGPEDLKGLDIGQLRDLAQELREEIIAVVSTNGGHLAPSLGVVELTLAMHRTFDSPRDRIVWDVGHQAYAHKILTGRRDRFHTLRKENGISGFPKRAESPHDAFDVGHSSTSISAALGMAVARDLKGEDHKVVALIGDGSMTAGLAFEGMNHAGHLKKDLIVVLNDNEMSISGNVGALSKYLSRIITGQAAARVKRETESLIKKLPAIGEQVLKFAAAAEDSMKCIISPGMLFEEMGFSYVGPVEGHNLDMLIETFEDVKTRKGPVLVHVLTKKGKGYEPAEEDPTSFHGTPPFDLATGKTAKSSGPSYTSVFGKALVELGRRDPSVVAISAAMPEGTGLGLFREKIPERFYDVGIAEPHGVTFATGLAAAGMKPVTAIYSTFLQRAYDQVVHDLCMQNLPVLIAMDRGGVVGEDGETHQGLFDLSYLRHIPNLVLMAPKDENEMRHMMYTGLRLGGPVALRYPRGAAVGVKMDDDFIELPLGRAEVLSEGDELTIIAIGNTVHPCVAVAERLRAAGRSVGVINARFVKPIDAQAVTAAAKRSGRILTVEENVIAGGFGSAVLETLQESGVRGAVVRRLGVEDVYVEQGTQAQIRNRLGLDEDGIERAATELLGVEVDSAALIENR